MIVHLIDGTYELFRHFYGQRRFNEGKDKPLGAVAGVLHTVLEMMAVFHTPTIQGPSARPLPARLDTGPQLGMTRQRVPR